MEHYKDITVTRACGCIETVKINIDTVDWASIEIDKETPCFNCWEKTMINEIMAHYNMIVNNPHCQLCGRPIENMGDGFCEDCQIVTDTVVYSNRVMQLVKQGLELHWMYDDSQPADWAGTTPANILATREEFEKHPEWKYVMKATTEGIQMALDYDQCYFYLGDIELPNNANTNQEELPF